MYKLTHHSFCGMSSIPETFDELDDVRAAVADRIRDARKNGTPVSILRGGGRWEFHEPEDSIMVPDSAGILCLDAILFECRECGCSHSDEDDALQCCNEDEGDDEFCDEDQDDESDDE